MWGTYGAPDMTHTHVIHRHLQPHRHTNAFSLQSEIPTHTHTHTHTNTHTGNAWAPAEPGVKDSGWFCVTVGISLILFLPFGEVCVHVWVCVCERLFQADGGSRGPFCWVNGEKLTSTDCCLPTSPLLSHFLSSLHLSKSASTPTSALSSHPFLLYLFLYFYVLFNKERRRMKSKGNRRLSKWKREEFYETQVRYRVFWKHLQSPTVQRKF